MEILSPFTKVTEIMSTACLLCHNKYSPVNNSSNVLQRGNAKKILFPHSNIYIRRIYFRHSKILHSWVNELKIFINRIVKKSGKIIFDE